MQSGPLGLWSILPSPGPSLQLCPVPSPSCPAAGAPSAELQGCAVTYCRVFTVIAGETLVQIMSKQSYSKLNPREKYYCKQ